MSSCRRTSCQIKCEYNLDRLTIILRSCQCNAGYEGSGTFCSEINPCTKPSRGGCHHEAVCTMTGPGANNCTCQDGFRGDGVVCVAIDPCQEKGAGYCHSNAECRYIGPGQVSLQCGSVSRLKSSNAAWFYFTLLRFDWLRQIEMVPGLIVFCCCCCAMTLIV